MATNNKVIVTVGREFGSGGHEVGKRLAQELGIAFYDQEFIAMAVKKTGFHEDYVKDNEEKAPDFVSGAMFTGMDIYQPSPYDRIQAEEYKLIREIAAKESCVIVGRAADYILSDQSHVSVFLFAPLQDRVNRKLALLSSEDAKRVTPAAMEKIVKQMDKRRKRYYEYYTDTKWGERDSYDLLLNTSRSGIDGAVKIIKTYIEECRGESIMPN